MKVIISSAEDFRSLVKNGDKLICFVSYDKVDATRLYNYLKSFCIGVPDFVCTTIESIHLYRDVVFYSFDGIRMSGYEINKIELQLPDHFQHAQIAENGIYHILKNGEELLCGEEFELLYSMHDISEYEEKICSKCHKIFKNGSLFFFQ